MTLKQVCICPHWKSSLALIERMREMQQGVSSHYTDRHLWGFWKKQFKYRSLARLLITNYLFMFEAYFPQCCFGMFTQMVLCSSLEHLFTNTSTTFMKLHDPAWTVPDLRIVLTFLQKKNTKADKKQTNQTTWMDSHATTASERFLLEFCSPWPTLQALGSAW